MKSERKEIRNILQLHDSAGLYGAESVILNLAAAMKHTRYHPVIGCLTMRNPIKPKFGRAAEEYDLAVQYLPMRNRIDISVIQRLCRLIQKFDIQIVHTHGYKSNLIGFLGSRLVNIPIVATNHLFPPMPLEDKKLQFYSKIDSVFTMRQMARIIAVSNEIRHKIIGAGIDEAKLTVIDNGIDIERYSDSSKDDGDDLRRSLGIGRDVFVVGTCGRLTQQKGLEYLLVAAKRVLQEDVSVVFLVAGDGPLRERLEHLAEELGISNNIRLLGFRRDTPSLLGIMDVFVMSSVAEGLPMAMIEAMASRTPVIVSSVGEIPKVIKDGVNGMLVPARDCVMLGNKLVHLLQDARLRDKLAESAFRDVKTNYSRETMCSKYTGIYDDILKRRN